MIVMTTWGLIYNQIGFVKSGNILLTIVNAAVLLIALWIIVEGLSAFFGNKTVEAKAEA